MDKQLYRDKQLLEDIYDLLSGDVALSPDQNDDLAKMHKQFAKDSKKSLHNYLMHKTMEWDPEHNTIKIGDHIVLKLEVV